MSDRGDNLIVAPDIEPLTPVQVVEYIEIFHMQCDKTSEQILAGEEYTLSATEKTEDLLFRINFFTGGLYDEVFNKRLPLDITQNSVASEAFLDDYNRAISIKEIYTGHLTAHWMSLHPFLRIELLETYPAEIYWFYKNIPEEILRRVYIEKDGMTLPQYLDLMEIYRLGWDKGFWLEYDGTGNLIRWDFILYGRESDTDECISRTSEVLWEHLEERELMQRYGLSTEKPLAFDWIIANPREAYTLATVTFRAYDNFPVHMHTMYDEFFEENDIPILPPKK